MRGFNKLVVMGRLTRDITLKYASNGEVMGLTTLAVSHRKRPLEERSQDETIHIEMVLFGKNAEHCQAHIGKGSVVLVDGRLGAYTQQSEIGLPRTAHQIVANQIEFLDRLNGE